MIRLRALAAAMAIVCAGCGGQNPSGPSTGGSSAVTSLAIIGSSQLELIGATNSLSALAFRANGTSTTVTASAAWQSSNPTAVTVSPTGAATAVGIGVSLISATYEGFSASLQMRVGAPIDCSSYLPADLSVIADGGTFTIVVPFGTGFQLLAGFATESDAAAGLAVFQRYRNYCHVGRNNTRTPRLAYIFGYWLNQSGLQTTINNEDCEAYDKSTVQVVSRGSSGWAVMASGRELMLLDTAADATTMAEMIKTYSNQCYIGRGNTQPDPARFIHPYWK